MDRAKLQQQVRELRGRIPDASLYELLGVPRDASDADIKKAFHAAARIFHVDNYPNVDLGDLRAGMQEVFGELSRAHATLTNPEKRREYDAALALNERGVPTDVRSIFLADESFRAGKRLVERGAYAEAKRQLEVATKLNRSEPDYWAYYHWAEFGLLETDANGVPKSDAAVRRITEALTQVLAENERCFSAALFLGHIARVGGDEKSAERYYKRVLANDAQNLEATSNLRLLNRRRESRNTGFFTKLFGGKK